ncbi:uncharacterized protein LY89DRAFT_736839 [Mollisia scopiformis]|uniref:Uncharacterized protein n=1 Tax=Mollisia scopiformis TaxID=149040 RepID=A0A194X0W9_MOLSC|nr:uncharacterized protein LY89DRAFT_736839 [Mollisia scopiformis]KUJ13843.1 hypothetical protein LY89DRAFT_736839 [Mollisia scopiformis]
MRLLSTLNLFLGLCASSVLANSLSTTSNLIKDDSLEITDQQVRSHTRDFAPLKLRDLELLSITSDALESRTPDTNTDDEALRRVRVEQDKVGTGNADGIEALVDGCAVVFAWAAGNVYCAHISENHEATTVAALGKLIGSKKIEAITLDWPKDASGEDPDGEAMLKRIETAIEKFNTGTGKVTPKVTPYSWAPMSAGQTFIATPKDVGVSTESAA